MNHIPPVAIFGFNRPACTEAVFNRVREVRPEQLFLCLDAPRENRPNDPDQVSAVKDIFKRVDWPCQVYRNYAETNMGCRARMGSGISWVFEHVEEAILLEDDCVPDHTFFPFCAELLQRYREDTRVGMIGGHVAHLFPINMSESYYFDRLNTIWGWATWKRAWNKFDANMSAWPQFKAKHGLRGICTNRYQEAHLAPMFDAVYEKRLGSWATAWALTCIRENFLCIHPSVNLVTNIGCGVDATHANQAGSPWSNRPLCPISFPLVHPVDMMPNLREEQQTIRCQYAIPYGDRVKGKLRRCLNSFMRKV